MYKANPYQSPSDGNRSRWFRPWRVIVAIVIFLSVVVVPILWQARREKAARDRAIQNLQQIRQALEQYQARERLRAPADAPD